MPKKTILLVEDEETHRELVASHLSSASIKVLTANDGVQGLAMALKYHPDLILLDIIMPYKDGIEMLRDLRRDPWGQTADVIMLTNLGDDTRINEVRSLGVADYLVKTNWKLGEVVKKVRVRLGLK